MAELVADCPRCGSNKVTFDIRADKIVGWRGEWPLLETFSICRGCDRSTVFYLLLRSSGEPTLAPDKDCVNDRTEMLGYVSLKDNLSRRPPDHLPQDIADIFREGATCLAVECYNAAATMFRLCLDMATRERLPKEPQEGLNERKRKSLGLRLDWLLDNGHLPEKLRSLSSCVREDGNDGAHEGTLTKTDAEDVLDFTEALLERPYTEPARLQLAEERRKERRNKPAEE